MSMWLFPSQTLSNDAHAFRSLWAERWEGCDPQRGEDAPPEVLFGHRHAYPEFRCPLSAAEERSASEEFHLELVSRLAHGGPVTIVTFDRDWDDHYETSHAARSLQRDPWVSLIRDPDDPDETEHCVTHLFFSTLAADDPTLTALLKDASDHNAEILVADSGLTWIVNPFGNCTTIHSFSPDGLEALRDVEQEIWRRWGIDHERHPVLDLAEIAAFCDNRRGSWASSGVEVVVGPQYRSFQGDRIEILHDLPADLNNVDWFRIELESIVADASVIVHDTGTCTVTITPEEDDAPDDADRFFSKEHAGTLDIVGATALLDRVVAMLTPAGGVHISHLPL